MAKKKLANLDGGKVNLISYSKKSTTPYIPVKFEVPAVAKYWIPAFASTDNPNDHIDSINDYVGKIDLDYVRYIPRTQTFVLGYPFDISEGAKALVLWSNFQRALDEGHIAQIVNNINAHFATRAWTEVEGFDLEYYYDRSRFVKSEVEHLITVKAFPKQTEATINIITDWLFEPEKVINSGYTEAVRRAYVNQSDIKKKVKKRYDNGDFHKWYDIIGVSGPIYYNQLLGKITESFEEYFDTPNASIKTATLTTLSNQKSFLEVLDDNYTKATNEDRGTEIIQGALGVSKPLSSASNENSNSSESNASSGNYKSSSVLGVNSTVLIVAGLIVAGLFFLKSRKR